MVKKAIICWGNTGNTVIDMIGAKNFDLVFLGFESAPYISRLKSITPNVLVLGYFDIVYHPNAGLAEECYIHDVNTGARLTRKGSSGIYIMNPESQVYRAYIISYCRGYLETGGYDGVMLDDWWTSLWESELSGSPDPSWNQGTPTRWQKALQGLIQYVKAQVPNKLWLYNGPSNGLYMEYCDPVTQGKCQEGFAYYWQSWRMPLDDINEFEKYSKLNYWYVGIPHVYTEATDTEHDFLYGFCCYLLALENLDKSFFGWMNFWTVEQGRGSSRGYYPQMDLNFGSPVGDKTRVIGDVWARTYEHYKVYVNLNHDAPATFTDAGQTITLQPKSGLLVETAPPVTHSLIISAGAGGTTDPVPGSYNYNEGTSAVVTAVLAPSYRFHHWEKDGAIITENPTIVLMDADHSLLAVFEYVPPPPVTATLTGTIKNSRNMQPIPQASVVCDGYGAVTDANGIYLILDIPAKQYTLTITKQGYQTQTMSVDASAGGTFTQDVNFDPVVVTAGFPLWAVAGVILIPVVGYLITRGGKK